MSAIPVRSQPCSQKSPIAASTIRAFVPVEPCTERVLVDRPTNSFPPAMMRLLPSLDPEPRLAVTVDLGQLGELEDAATATLHDPCARMPDHAGSIGLVARSHPVVA